MYIALLSNFVEQPELAAVTDVTQFSLLRAGKNAGA
jgi:hypothetical protein